MYYGVPPRCIEVTTLCGRAPLYTDFLRPHQSRLVDLRPIKHLPWFALYPPDEYVSGIKGLLMSKWEPFLLRVFGLDKPIVKSRRADSNR
jgi:hypothetical protein